MKRATWSAGDIRGPTTSRLTRKETLVTALNVDLCGMPLLIFRYLCCTGDQMFSCSLKAKIWFPRQILNLVVLSNCFIEGADHCCIWTAWLLSSPCACPLSQWYHAWELSFNVHLASGRYRYLSGVSSYLISYVHCIFVYTYAPMPTSRGED